MFPVADDPNLRKRGRDDDFEDAVFGNGPLSFQEHRNKQKRIQHMPLPLRSSPPRPPSHPPRFGQRTATPPVPSPHQVIVQEQHVGGDAEEHGAGAGDCDMDMMMDSHLSPGSMQPDFDPAAAVATAAGNPALAHHANALANRMPTPIQPSFAAQVHPQMHERKLAAQQMAAATMEGGIDSDTVPRTMEGTDWAQTRRLPSPISEGGDADFPVSPGMVLDSNYHQMHHEHPHVHEMAQMQQLQQQQQQQTGEEDVGIMDVDGLGSGTPSPPKKGHTRSRHTLSSWTLKPGMKKSFSIGYRSDCEKCRQKVPGHFNHIIIS